MLRTVQFACVLPKAEADTLNRESGRVYSNTLIWHYRVYRRLGVWLAPKNGERLEDTLGGPTTLHAHCRDAAQQGFYKACKTAKASQAVGLASHYPHKRKHYRTTIWKQTGIYLKVGLLLLARKHGLTPVSIVLPPHLLTLSAKAFLEVRLVWDRVARHYNWHVVIEDGSTPEAASGNKWAAVDLGEIHPAALTDGKEALIISCRALRANQQYTAKRLAELKARQDQKHKASRRWKRLQRRKQQFLAKQRRRARDMEHKISRAIVTWAKEYKIGTLAVGDVRNIANGKRLNSISQQKIGVWSHGRQSQYLMYKAEAAGINTTFINEAYTSQTCPECQQRSKPLGRRYACPTCGFVAHRDAVGSANILSLALHRQVGQIKPPLIQKYRHPFQAGKRSRLDTPDLAWYIR